ncbi:MAG: tetraacyldisaccharide 4'-kinase [Desulfobacteraceae bacterium]|nr:tetraacyldisaccharide 4'-kinase [Desulfobacteraceae bacterium]
MAKRDGPIPPRMMSSIAAVMNEDPSASRRLAVVLKGLASLYGIGVQCRTQLFRNRWRVPHRLPCKVVSIGNITLGGTGKTPMSVYMARLIHGFGCRVAIVSRGYKGAAEKNGGVVSDGQALRMDPASAGDEPFLMAQQLLPLGIPVIVGRDRVRAGRRAVQRYQTEVIVLDDGFQHVRLARDLDIVLLDAQHPFGNGHLVPRGTLREPLSSLSRAEACLLTRCLRAAIEDRLAGQPRSNHSLAGDNRRRPVFAAAHAPFISECFFAKPADDWAAKIQRNEWHGCPVFAFSGLARNDAFQKMLCEMGFELRGYAAFADHHDYSHDDILALAKQAARMGAHLLVTTEKDRVKLADTWFRNLPLLVVGVRMDLGAASEAFERFVARKLGLPSSSGP